MLVIRDKSFRYLTLAQPALVVSRCRMEDYKVEPEVNSKDFEIYEW